MSLTSPDAKAVVRAVDALSTQVRRIADALSAAPDASPTTTDDGPTPDFTSPIAGRIEVRRPCPYCGDRQMIPRHQFEEHVMRMHSDVRRGGPGVPVPPVEAPAADEDARTLAADDVIRAARHDSLGVLLSRISNGLTLTPDEAKLLVEHVDAEVREGTTARSVAAGNKRHVQVMYAELEQAQAAIERVRKLASRWAVLRAYGGAAAELRAALDDSSPAAPNLVRPEPNPQASEPLRVDEEPGLADEEGQPVCTCTYGARCPNCRD